MYYLKYGLALFIFTLSLNTNAQNVHFGERIILGSSLTYIWNFNEFDRRIRYDEFTWDNNIAVSLNKSLYFGLSFKNINTSGSIVSQFDYKKNHYFLMGPFLQYDFLPKEKNRLFAEISWNYGNYCTCENEDPYKKEGLSYWGVGGGYDYPLNKFISLDFAFVVYSIFDKVVDNYRRYSYTQYTLGLNLDLVHKR